eukprot:TRINITY_DN57547_c0_g1_i1.p1 TRINITY_DN57547_c0_g1~~TRINITY_DN57547_c0_g1_i1.p1  ORF type:complete len:1641 (+),score=303.38 TRINITY_DN57547_c0_g1_i1:63-4985(+)
MGHIFKTDAGSGSRRSITVAAKVDKLEAGGIAIQFQQKRFWLPWPLFGLAEAPAVRRDGAAMLKWRMHCVDPESRPGDYHVGAQNTRQFKVLKGGRLSPDKIDLKPGVLELEVEIERGSEISICLALRGTSLPLQLHLARPLSCCLTHRQAWDKGAAVLAGDNVLRAVRVLSVSTCSSDVFHGRQKEEMAYAARWGASVELEAAASAVESNDSRLLFGVYITWKACHEAVDMSRRNPLIVDRFGKRRQGHFDIPVSLARSHRLKFRSLLIQGGECASSWLCLRGDPGSTTEATGWSGHARVIQAGTLEDGEQLSVEDEDLAPDAQGTRSIRVSLELLDESSDASLPSPEMPFLVEYVPKSLSYSCMHMALSDVNPLERADGEPQRPLLARNIVLERVQLTTHEDSIDLNAWKLNCSQEQAVRRALARQLMLIHGPAGTGKTRTAAVLMTVFAQRNLGSKGAIMFGAPTNRAVDCALLYTNQLCESHFAERLRARVEDNGDEECAICLDKHPDVVTACGHVFHKSCLACSFEESSLCPMCRQVLKQPKGGLRMLRVYGADAERKDFPIPKRHDHQGIQTFKVQSVPESMRRFSWHWRCHAAVDGEEPSEEALQCRKAYERLKGCSAKDPNFNERRTEYYVSLTKARAAEVRQTDIIFSTCVSARRLALQEALALQDAPEVRQVVMDEAGQSPEPEALCLLGLPRSATQAVLFGDHRQLRPILRSKAAERAGLGVSLFERLATSNEHRDSASSPVALLAQQYRMHPAISQFPRQHFYGGHVTDHPCVNERSVGILASPSAPAENTPLLVWDVCDGLKEEQLQRVRTVGAGGVGSRANLAEAIRTAGLAVELAGEAGQEAVAVLSWYNSQVSKIAEILKRDGYGQIHVGSIATAQGSEWEYVLLSSVRSGANDGHLGILSDPHTLNVALTRARRGLVILCDSVTLRQDTNWSMLLKSCQSRGLVVTKRPVVRRRRPQIALKRPSEEVLSSLSPMLEDFDEAMAWLQRFQGDLVSERASARTTSSSLPDLLSTAQAGQLGNVRGPLGWCSCGKFASPDKGSQCNSCGLASGDCSTDASRARCNIMSSVVASSILHQERPRGEHKQSKSGEGRNNLPADRSCSRARGQGSIGSRKRTRKSRNRSKSKVRQSLRCRSRSSSDDTGSSIICSFPGYRNKRLKKSKPAPCSSSSHRRCSVSSGRRSKDTKKKNKKARSRNRTMTEKKKHRKSPKRHKDNDRKEKNDARKTSKSKRKHKKQKCGKKHKKGHRAAMLVEDSDDAAQGQADEATTEHVHANESESLRISQRVYEDSPEQALGEDDVDIHREKEKDEDEDERKEKGDIERRDRHATLHVLTQDVDDEQKSSVHDNSRADELRVSTDRKATRRAEQYRLERECDCEKKSKQTGKHITFRMRQNNMHATNIAKDLDNSQEPTRDQTGSGETHADMENLSNEGIGDNTHESLQEDEDMETQEESEYVEDEVEADEGIEMPHAAQKELEAAALDDDGNTHESMQENDDIETQEESEHIEDDEEVEADEGQEMQHAAQKELEGTALDDDESLSDKGLLVTRGEAQSKNKHRRTLIRSVFVVSSDESSEETSLDRRTSPRVNSRVWVHGGYGDAARMSLPHGVARRKLRAKLVPRSVW